MRPNLPVLLAAAFVAAGCSSSRELTGAAAARSRGAAVTGIPEAPPKFEAADPLTDYARVLARVNGKVITLRQVRHQLGPTYEQNLDQRELLIKAIEARTQDLVLKQLILDEAQKLGMGVSDEDMREDLEEQEERAASRGTTVEQNLIDQGITRREWDQERRERINVRQASMYFQGYGLDKWYREEFFRPSVDPYVSPDEVRRWGEGHAELVMFQQESASFRILDLRKDDFGGPDATDRERRRLCAEAMDAALARVQAGESFGEVVRAVSRGPEAADGGLVVGVSRRSPYRQEYLDFVFGESTRSGDVSPKIEVPTGCIVLLLEERKEASSRPIEVWAPAVRRRLEEMRRELVTQEVLLRLLDEAAVSPREFRDSVHASLQDRARKVRESLR